MDYSKRHLFLLLLVSMREVITTAATGTRGFLSLDTLTDPRLDTIPALVLGARQWIFPSMVFTCNGSITKWVFRAVPTVGSQLPQFQVWKRTNDAFLNDYTLVATSGSSLELEDQGLVYAYRLQSPIAILENYTFGILLPFGSQSELYSLVVELWGIVGAPTSYYRSSIGTTFNISITGVPIQDYIPLVTAEISQAPIETPTPTTTTTTITTTTTTTTTPSVVPQDTTRPPDGSPEASRTLPLALGIVIGLLLMFTAILVVCFIVVKRKKKQPHVDESNEEDLMYNPSYEQFTNNHLKLHRTPKATKSNHEPIHGIETATAANVTTAIAVPAARNKVFVNTEDIVVFQNEAYGVLEPQTRSNDLAHGNSDILRNSETDEDYAYVQLRARI